CAGILDDGRGRRRPRAAPLVSSRSSVLCCDLTRFSFLVASPPCRTCCSSPNSCSSLPRCAACRSHRAASVTAARRVGCGEAPHGSKKGAGKRLGTLRVSPVTLRQRPAVYHLSVGRSHLARCPTGPA